MDARTVVHARIQYSLQAATTLLPRDVTETVFLKLANHCLPGAKVVTDFNFQKLVALARNFQRLSDAEQAFLLFRASTRHKQVGADISTETVVRDPAEQEAWVKERVSNALSWMRDLQKLGVASASSYIFAGRRSSPQPPKDWANDVLHFHYCEELSVQDSVVKFLDGVDNAFVLLPDRRWCIKYEGDAVPPLADKFGGLSSIQSLIRKNFMDRTVVRDEEKKPYCIFMPTSSALSDKRQKDNYSHLLNRNNLDANCTTKSFDTVRGNQAHDPGKRKVVHGRSNPEYKQIVRVIAEIAVHSTRVAGALNSSITRDSLGVLSFTDPTRSGNWITDLPELTSDALFERRQAGWRVRTPLSDEVIDIPPERERGMAYIARLLQQRGISVPVGLLSDQHLVDALVDRPPYQKLFSRTNQRLVKLGDHIDFDNGTRSIIDAVDHARGYRSKYYEITHVITQKSPLASFITTGFVSLTPHGLGGVLHLLKKRLAECVLDGTKTRELTILVENMDKAVKYVTRYEHLAAEIEPQSNAAREKVQKAISSAIQFLWDLGEHSLGKYLEKHISTGKLCSHDGPWLWEVRGLSEFPDVIDLAKDHIYMKLRKFARQNGELSLTAIHSRHRRSR